MGYAESKLYRAGLQMEGRIQAANIEARRALKRGDADAGYRYAHLSLIRSNAVQRLFEWERRAARAGL